MSKGKTIAMWIVSILLAAMFLLSGGFKLLKAEDARTAFVHYGYAPWFAIFIGVSEVLGAIGLLVPRLASLAAAGLSIIMIGAVYTHLTHQEASHAVVPIVLLALLIGVGYARFSAGRA
jgi:putative oxidoreductase